MRALVLSFAFALSAAPAFAQTSEEEIVVTGRFREALREFVGEIAQAPGAEDQLAVWDGAVCPGVVGLQNAGQAQFIVDRISERAVNVGLEAGRSGCRANILILVAPDANAVAAALASEYDGLMSTRRTENVGAGDRAALDLFVNSGAAVRWWHVAHTVSADGFAVHEPMLGRTPVVRVFSPSRLRATTRQDFSNVVILVDATRAQGVRLDALADYIAMVSLAQIDPTADTSAYPSILNLFRADGAALQAMTDWDRAYLDGLYEATRNAVSARRQAGEIADSMGDALEPPQQ